MERIFAEVLDELFGPEVDHGKDELDQRSSHSCQPPRDRFGSGAAV
jgi:hypothetical protein